MILNIQIYMLTLQNTHQNLWNHYPVRNDRYICIMLVFLMFTLYNPRHALYRTINTLLSLLDQILGKELFLRTITGALCFLEELWVLWIEYLAPAVLKPAQIHIHQRATVIINSYNKKQLLEKFPLFPIFFAIFITISTSVPHIVNAQKFLCGIYIL